MKKYEALVEILLDLEDCKSAFEKLGFDTEEHYSWIHLNEAIEELKDEIEELNLGS